MVDFSRFTGKGETTEVTRQQDPREQLRSQASREANPTYYQKTVERDGGSTWSGSSFGGREWSGRG